MLLNLITLEGTGKWVLIARQMTQHFSNSSYIAKTCRERWISHVDPTIRRDPWLDHEHIEILT
jgi:hypothetical protein